MQEDAPGINARSTYRGEPAPVRLYWSVGLLSCGLIGYEIALMRVLLYASWHHFAFLIISAALLGFGISGTALSLLRPWLLARSDRAIPVLIFAAAFSMPLSVQAAQHLPVSAQIVPVLWERQALAWIAYWMMLTVPFVLGASAIGLALMAAGGRLAAVYAANLGGSAAGAVAAPACMYLISPAWLSVAMGGLVFAALIPLVRRPGDGIRAGAAVLAGGIWFYGQPPAVRVDPGKYRAYIDRLVADGRAVQAASACGPRAVIEVFRSDTFHELPFLSVGTAPPPMDAIVMDGHWAGSLLRIARPEEGEAMDRTLMAAVYGLAPPAPSVLLLGECGGANVWLALRHAAKAVHVVQPDRRLTDLLTGPLRREGGVVFTLPGVSVHTAEPRHFVEADAARYEVIQLVATESWATSSTGIEGLNQDHLITVEGLTACLRRLSPDGILHVSRGIQLPPRDSVKLLATLLAALKRLGAARPEEHVAIVRDFLGVCTMVKRRPWTPEDIGRLRALCGQRALTPVYFPGVRPEELNHPDLLPGPPGAAGDWLHETAIRLFSGQAETFLASGPFDVRPPTDDRPFFANFGKLAALGAFREAYGDLWLLRTEIAELFVLVAAGVILLGSILLIATPLLLVRAIRRAPGAGAVAGYFFCIGLGYLMAEVVFLTKLQRLVGDPVLAGAATIAGFLVWSGAGTLTVHRLKGLRQSALYGLFILLAVVGAAEMAGIDGLAVRTGGWAAASRVALAVVLIGPLGFLMGCPFPLVLARLEQRLPALVPWAWGINGCASVLASPVAIFVSMHWGFGIAGIAAFACYLVAAGTVRWMKPDVLASATYP